jgi:hypothetical protein
VDGIAYIVRPGENDELKFSLRSIDRHFPGVPVFIVGDMPDWCRPDGYLPGNRYDTKPLNVWDNLTLLTGWHELPDEIVVMNDDMYITAPIDHIPVLYRGTLQAHIRSLGARTDDWAQSLVTTAELLGPDALSYELHTPFPCNRHRMAETLDRDPGQVPPQWRTIYGNQWHKDAVRADDVKIKRFVTHLPSPFASTHDISFRFVRPALELTYTTPSRYER